MERRIEEAAKARLGRDVDAMLYCPARSMQLKEARTLVRLPGTGAEARPLDHFSEEFPRLQDLQQRYPRLWKLYVFTSEADADARRKLQEICLRALPEGCVNALRI